MRESQRPAELSLVVLLLMGMGLLSAVCLVDRAAGGSSALTYFYLAPVYFVAWSVGAVAGVTLAVLSFVAMNLVHANGNWPTFTDNLGSPSTVLALIFFVVTALLLAQLNRE